MRIDWACAPFAVRLPPPRCLRCLLLVMRTHLFAKEALTLHLARSEGHEHYFGCNLMHCKVLVSSHQHLMAEAPGRGEMTKSPITLQELRRRIYVKAKAEKSWRFFAPRFRLEAME